MREWADGFETGWDAHRRAMQRVRSKRMKRNRRIHIAGMVVWTLLLWPSMTSWRTAIAYVVFMSWYANWSNHWVGYEAASSGE